MGFSIGNVVLFAVTLWSVAEFGTPTEFYDLGYSVNTDTVFFPGQKEFQLNKDYDAVNKSGYWYSAFSFCMAEHGGTHVDSPFHFYKDGWTVDQIPPQHLIDVPAVVIDVSSKVERGGEYSVTVEDLVRHESRFGKTIPFRGVALVYTGWSKYYGNKGQYLGWRNESDPATLTFPGISVEAAKFLADERQVVGIGIDTPSVDVGSTKTFPAHQVLAQKQIYNIENVANLHMIASSRCDLALFVLPVKIVGATGSPTRILAYCKSH